MNKNSMIITVIIAAAAGGIMQNKGTEMNERGSGMIQMMGF